MDYIKPLNCTEMIKLVAIIGNAYPAFKLNSDEDKLKLADRLVKQQEESKVMKLYGLFRDEKMVGGMRFHNFIMNMHNEFIPAGGIGMVAVDLAHKKEKVAKSIVLEFLKHYYNKDTSIVMLYPFRPDFYKNMGFGYGTKMDEYRIKPSALPKGYSKEHIKVLTKDDKEEIHACYNRFFERTHGMLAKYQQDYAFLDSPGEIRAYGCKKDGRIKGYMFFAFKEAKQGSFLMNNIEIKAFVYEDREALSEMLAFLHSQDDQINRVVLQTQDKSLQFLLSDPRNGTDNLIPSVYHECNTQGVGLMYRVINVKKLFEQMKDHNFGSQDLVLKLNVKDSFFNLNDGSIVIAFEKGRAKVMEGNNKEKWDASITMDISDFSSLITGAVNFKTLYTYNLAEISEEAYLEKINKMFYSEEKPMCMTAF